MNDEHILALTATLSSIGTKVDNVAEIVKELKKDLDRNYPTKVELNAVKERFEREVATIKTDIETLRSEIKEKADRSDVNSVQQAFEKHVESDSEKPYKKWMLAAAVAGTLGSLGGIATFVSWVAHH